MLACAAGHITGRGAAVLSGGEGPLSASVLAEGVLVLLAHGDVSLELCSRLEARCLRLLDLDGLACLRVPSRAGGSLPLLEGPEAGDRDLLPAGDGVGDDVDDSLECLLCFASRPLGPL